MAYIISPRMKIKAIITKVCTNLARGLSNKEMKFQNKGAVPVQIACLLFCQTCNQNQMRLALLHT